jgi:hypothetical protein
MTPAPKAFEAGGPVLLWGGVCAVAHGLMEGQPEDLGVEVNGVDHGKAI